MTRVVTLVGFAVLAAAAVVLELVARRSPRLCTLGDALGAVLRHLPLRLLLLAGWLWLGWHTFVRATWR